MKELTISEIQQGSFILLDKLTTVLEKHGWHYYLAYGTLIGAVRHKGFIPWDDDIDIWMLRSDYESFLKYYLDNAEEFRNYRLFHYSTNKRYPYPIMRFSDKKHTVKYKNVKDYGLGLFVDIYPLDEIIPTDMTYRKRINKERYAVARAVGTSDSLVKSIARYLYRIPSLLLFSCHSRSELINDLDRNAQLFNGEGTGYLANTNWDYYEPNYYYFPQSFFIGDETKLLFNGKKFAVPCEYEKVLNVLYGDYMKLPPLDKQHPTHNYSVFSVEE